MLARPGSEHAWPSTVCAAQEERCRIAQATGQRSTSYLEAVVEPQDHGSNRFHVQSMARYRTATGPVSFTVTIPFHHLIMGCMIRNARRGACI